MIKTFLNSESGAVTVDWVVLTAAIVGLGLAVMAVVSAGVENLSGDIQTQLETNHITTTFGD
ncbi:pilus assembly protein [Nioella nitratireducens]|uniref:pilus assembly protein n=1 Tax=Nioella nitratireducens TaxID=1287720 RepID=UPI0008FD5374|nr:pilus assembly protein [Nioella nitratireducens]